jgi:hypothetical protein
MISAGEQPQTYALDRTATGTGKRTDYGAKNLLNSAFHAEIKYSTTTYNSQGNKHDISNCTGCNPMQAYLSFLGCYVVSNGKQFHYDNQYPNLLNQAIHEAQNA